MVIPVTTAAARLMPAPRPRNHQGVGRDVAGGSSSFFPRQPSPISICREGQGAASTSELLSGTDNSNLRRVRDPLSKSRWSTPNNQHSGPGAVAWDASLGAPGAIAPGSMKQTFDADVLVTSGNAVLPGADARTSVNLLGNCVASAVVARWEGVDFRTQEPQLVQVCLSKSLQQHGAIRPRKMDAGDCHREPRFRLWFRSIVCPDIGRLRGGDRAQLVSRDLLRYRDPNGACRRCCRRIHRGRAITIMRPPPEAALPLTKGALRR